MKYIFISALLLFGLISTLFFLVSGQVLWNRFHFIFPALGCFLFVLTIRKDNTIDSDIVLLIFMMLYAICGLSFMEFFIGGNSSKKIFLNINITCQVIQICMSFFFIARKFFLKKIS